MGVIRSSLPKPIGSYVSFMHKMNPNADWDKRAFKETLIKNGTNNRKQSRTENRLKEAHNQSTNRNTGRKSGGRN